MRTAFFVSIRLAEKGGLAWLALAASLLPGCQPATPPLATAPAAPRAAVTRLPYYHEATFAPHWYPAGQAPPDTLLHTVGRFHFTDQQGQAVTNATLAGRIYLANFFFTQCPGICPRMNEHVRQILAHFAGHPDVLAARDSGPTRQLSVLSAHRLVDRTSHLRGLYNGTLAVGVGRMEEDIVLLLQE